MDSNVDDADDEIVGDEGTAKNQAVVHLTGRWRTKIAMNWKLKSLQAAVRSPTQRKRSPQHAPTGRSTGHALSQIAVLEARAAAASSREDGMNAQGRPLRTRTPVNYAEDVQSQRWTQ
jgi:hypothetical protein